jgi:hypothetical protein
MNQVLLVPPSALGLVLRHLIFQVLGKTPKGCLSIFRLSCDRLSLPILVNKLKFLHSICEVLPMDSSMTFWDKLGMYVDAVGLENAGVAWDLSLAPMSDVDHRDFATALIAGIQP